MHHIDVKILDPRLKNNQPHYATPGAAGLDMRVCIDIVNKLTPGETHMVPT